jgi:hypothetical protein
MSVEFDCKGHAYRAGQLPAMQQFHVVRRMGGLLAALVQGMESGANGKTSLNPEVLLQGLNLSGMGDLLESLARAVAELEDADAEYVIHTCLSTVSRKQSSGGWAKVCVDQQIMFEDIDMAAMLTLTGRVLQENLKGFFAALPEGIPGAGRASSSPPSE